MAEVIFPNDLTNGQPADADQVMANFNALTDQINGNLDDDNIANSAITTAKLNNGAVTTAKLADGAVTAPKLGAGIVGAAAIADHSLPLSKILTPNIAGSIPIAQNGIGEFAAIPLSGPVLVGTDGGTIITHPFAVGADTSLNNDGVSYVTISGLSVTPAPGVYVVLAKAFLTGPGGGEARARLLVGGADTDHSYASVVDSVSRAGPVTLIDVVAVNGSEAITVQAVGVSFAGGWTATYGRLVCLQVE